MNYLSAGMPIREVNPLKLLPANGLGRIGIYGQLQAQQDTILFLFGNHPVYCVKWKHSHSSWNQQWGTNWLFLLDQEDPIKFTAADGLHIANKQIETTLYQR
ncbi:hypothetical protein H6F90_11665 [Trichocoleus sp. FACHB-591]|uniref:hypothetical protein n=1 Tax=Trichocoleus TaxID=450526 RepID=UPI0016849C86|nr:hypothetical protein [Trichocoleus sp. FACHB-591]MBD2095807.1 hypothetical protein [Trichocoleus sp. FACHB-591]